MGADRALAAVAAAERAIGGAGALAAAAAAGPGGREGGPEPSHAIVFPLVCFSIGVFTRLCLKWTRIPYTATLLVRRGRGRGRGAGPGRGRGGGAPPRPPLAAGGEQGGPRRAHAAPPPPPLPTRRPPPPPPQLWGVAIGLLQLASPPTRVFTHTLTLWLARARARGRGGEREGARPRPTRARAPPTPARARHPRARVPLRRAWTHTFCCWCSFRSSASRRRWRRSRICCARAGARWARGGGAGGRRGRAGRRPPRGALLRAWRPRTRAPGRARAACTAGAARAAGDAAPRARGRAQIMVLAWPGVALQFLLIALCAKYLFPYGWWGAGGAGAPQSAPAAHVLARGPRGARVRAWPPAARPARAR